jgi:muconolactone delta-isomerase
VVTIDRLERKMKFLITYRPQNPAPADQVPELLKGMGEWMQKYGGRVEDIYFFTSGGGFGTIETDDAGELSRLVAEHPFTPYADVQIDPLIDPQSAMENLIAANS